MSLSQLQLERYFFTRLKIEANVNFDRQKALEVGTKDVDVTIKGEILKNEKKPRNYQITLTMENLESKENLLPYHIDFQSVGLFSVSPTRRKDVDKFIHVNGSSLVTSSL